MVKYSLILFFILVSVGFAQSASMEPLDAFLERIYIEKGSLRSPERWSAESEEIITYFEDETQTIIKGKRIFNKRYNFFDKDSFDVQVISERVEGDPPKPRERKKGDKRRMDDKKMPFLKTSANQYKYNDDGMVDYSGSSVRKISFKATVRDEEHYDGFALFDPETARMLKLDFSFADNPSAFKYFKGRMEFSYLGDYQVMNTIDVSVRGRFLFVIKFNVRFEQRFKNFQINS